MEEREDIKETGNKFADGLLMPIFAVGAVFLFIVLCFYAYNNVMKNKNNNEIVVLNGDESSFKVAPENPGGMEVEHTDKAVFNTVSGTNEGISGDKLNVQSQEQPVTQEQLAANAIAPSAESPQDEKTTSTVIINTSDNNQVTEQDPAAPVAEDAAPAVAVQDPTQAPATPAAVPATDTAATTTTTTTTISTQPEKAPEPVKIEAKKEEPKVEVKAVAKEAPKASVKAEVKKETDKTTGENKTVINFKAMPKSMGGKAAPAAAAVEKGSFYVQISSNASRADAEAAWVNLVKKYSSEVAGKSQNITEADVNGKKYYRLSFGPFKDRGDASTKCGILKAKGQDCIIQKY